MKRKNAGFSLIELIVVITIMVILVGVAGTWLSNIIGYRARECASKVSSSLSSTKVTSMSKAVNSDDVTWDLYRGTDNCYHIDVTVNNTAKSTSTVDSSKVSKSSVTIVYYKADGSEITLGSSDHLKLYYNRSTGMLCTYGTTTKADVVKIAARAGKKEYSFEVVPLTGKVSSTLDRRYL